MTERTTTMRRLRALMTAALAALALSGCAATHVGEDWQCPLAQGTQCASVAAADPAVKRTDGTAVPAPPMTAPDGGTGDACIRGCNPFAWIARLFAGPPDDAAAGEDGPEKEAAATATDSPAATQEKASAPAADGTADSLRAPERIARVWIAPFADADGVFREASWVRIVIEPAGWRRP